MCVAKGEVYKQQRAELLWNFHSRSRQRATMMDFANCAGLWLNTVTGVNATFERFATKIQQNWLSCQPELCKWQQASALHPAMHTLNISMLTL